MRLAVADAGDPVDRARLDHDLPVDGADHPFAVAEAKAEPCLQPPTSAPPGVGGSGAEPAPGSTRQSTIRFSPVFAKLIRTRLTESRISWVMVVPGQAVAVASSNTRSCGAASRVTPRTEVAKRASEFPRRSFGFASA